MSEEKSDEDLWEEMEEEFITELNVVKKYTILRKALIKCNVCKSEKCEVFPQQHELGSLLQNMQRNYPKVYTLEDAIKKYEGKKDYKLKNFEKDYDDYILNARSVMDKIFALFSTKKTRDNDFQIRHKQRLEFIEVCNKNNSPIPVEHHKEIQEWSNEYKELEEKYYNDPSFKKAKEKMKKQAK